MWLFLDESPSTQSNGAIPIPYAESMTSAKQAFSDEIPSRDVTDRRDENAQCGFFEVLRQLKWPSLWEIFLMKFLFGLALLANRGNFLQTLERKYNTDAVTNEYMVSMMLLSEYVGLGGRTQTKEGKVD